MTGGGADLEDVIRERRRELDMLDDADLETDTTHPAEPAPAAAPAPQAKPDNEDEEDDDPDAGGQPARVYTFKRDQE